MKLDMQDTAITTKAATIPIGMEVAKILGVSITDVGTYLSLFIGCLVVIDYMWKWYRRYKTPIAFQHYIDKLESQENKE
jgi:hypothetical protein